MEAVARLRSGGATAIGGWIAAATELFEQAPARAAPRHPAHRRQDRGRAAGRARRRRSPPHAACSSATAAGIGSDWVVDELRKIADALLGTVDIVAEPEDLEDDFESMIRTSMSRGVADARLRVWAPQGSEVLFVRQVAPRGRGPHRRRPCGSARSSSSSRPARGATSRATTTSPCGCPSAPVGNERLAARVEIVVDDQVLAEGAREGDLEHRHRPDHADRSGGRPLHRSGAAGRRDPARPRREVVGRRAHRDGAARRGGEAGPRRAATRTRPGCWPRWSTSSTSRPARCG